MCFSRPIQWYPSHADPTWPDGNFNLNQMVLNKKIKSFANIYDS